MYSNEICWQTKWLHSSEESPATVVENLECSNASLYPNVNAIITVLLTVPISTATPECSFNKTYNNEQLSALTLLQAYRDMTTDKKAVAGEFGAKRNREISDINSNSPFQPGIKSRLVAEIFNP